jgi:hypothetical protein
VLCRKLVARMKLLCNENKVVARFPGSSTVERSAVNRRVPRVRVTRPLIRILRYNFGTFEEREFRWVSLQATPAKAFSVFPNLLCKQGAAGSSPATSTNLFHFKKIASEFFAFTTFCSGRGSGSIA